MKSEIRSTQKKKLEFYIEPEEMAFKKLGDIKAQNFTKRMKLIRDAAEAQYQQILSGNNIDWKNQNHVRAVAAFCQEFQDFSFVRQRAISIN